MKRLEWEKRQLAVQLLDTQRQLANATANSNTNTTAIARGRAPSAAGERVVVESRGSHAGAALARSGEGKHGGRRAADKAPRDAGGDARRSSSPPPFVGPKGVYKDDRPVGRGGGCGEESGSGGQGYAQTGGGLWTRVLKTRGARVSEGRGGMVEGERERGRSRGRGKQIEKGGAMGNKEAASGGEEIDGDAQGAEVSAAAYALKQQDWVESCIEMISGIVEANEGEDADDGDEDDELDAAFGRELSRVRADMHGEQQWHREYELGLGREEAAGVAGGGRTRGVGGIGSPKSQFSSFVEMDVDVPVYEEGGLGTQGLADSSLASGMSHVSTAPRALPDTSPHWDTAPGARGSLRGSEILVPPMPDDIDDFASHSLVTGARVTSLAQKADVTQKPDRASDPRGDQTGAFRQTGVAGGGAFAADDSMRMPGGKELPEAGPGGRLNGSRGHDSSGQSSMGHDSMGHGSMAHDAPAPRAGAALDNLSPPYKLSREPESTSSGGKVRDLLIRVCIHAHVNTYARARIDTHTHTDTFLHSWTHPRTGIFHRVRGSVSSINHSTRRRR